jgi:hypothetical protein
MTFERTREERGVAPAAALGSCRARSRTHPADIVVERCLLAEEERHLVLEEESKIKIERGTSESGCPIGSRCVGNI